MWCARQFGSNSGSYFCRAESWLKEKWAKRPLCNSKTACSGALSAPPAQTNWAASSATSDHLSNFVKHTKSAAHEGWVMKLTRNSDDVADHVAPSGQELFEVF